MVGGCGEPRVHRGDRLPRLGGGEEQEADEVFGFTVEVGVGPSAGAAAAGSELGGELLRLDFVGHIRQRVPPPGRWFVGDLVRVEDPHRPDFGAGVAGGVDDVTFGQGDQERLHC